MKKLFITLLIISSALLGSAAAYAEYLKFDIKYGMHERIVNQKYGDPLDVLNIKVNPIPQKKALYEIDKVNFMILHFFSGRIYKIVLLEGMALDEASTIFKEE